MKKSTLYFSIAFLPIVVAGPIDSIILERDWGAALKLLLSASLAGLTALKALQSTPDGHEPSYELTEDVAPKSAAPAAPPVATV